MQDYFDNVLARWQLMRPLLQTRIQFTESSAVSAVFHPTIAQSILKLLNNAADASERVDIDLGWNTEMATISIRDFGAGLDTDKMKMLGQPFVTDKADGLRTMGIVTDSGELFLIDQSMNVYRTGLQNPKCKKSIIS